MMSGMRILLLGCNGFVGRQAAVALARHADVSVLTLADYDIRTSPPVRVAAHRRA